MSGLLPTPTDNRDILGASFLRPADLGELPDLFVHGPLDIKNQGNSDACTGHMIASMSEQQEGSVLSPAYSFAKIKEIRGEYTEWGASLRDAMKAGLKGFLEEADSPYNFSQDTRDFIANWENWDSKYDAMSEEHKKKAYIKITPHGYDDLFDAIRGALWEYRDEKRTVGVGVNWNSEWTNAPLGVIDSYTKQGFGHAIAIIGFKEDYLIVQNSYGKSVGKDGLFYFHRDVVNGAFTYGAYMFVDMPEGEDKDSLIEKSKLLLPLWKRIIEWIKSFV